MRKIKLFLIKFGLLTNRSKYYRFGQLFTSRKISFLVVSPNFQSSPAMHVAWSYCQAGFDRALREPDWEPGCSSDAVGSRQHPGNGW